MSTEMSMEDVRSRIQRLEASGQSLNKKKVKQSHPDLMQGALFYFPSWDHAIQSSLGVNG